MDYTDTNEGDIREWFHYHPAHTVVEQNAHQECRDHCWELALWVMDNVGPCNEMWVALEKLREVMYWSNAGLAIYGPKGSRRCFCDAGDERLATLTPRDCPLHPDSAAEAPAAPTRLPSDPPPGDEPLRGSQGQVVIQLWGPPPPGGYPPERFRRT